ncbi:MAG TPA: hypothetical protein HPP77_03700 [Candidatus Hydrogenedentes bacterium]|nr:hypothetical protein [Candidatus Hydrogenedentota bacterium]
MGHSRRVRRAEAAGRSASGSALGVALLEVIFAMCVFVVTLTLLGGAMISIVEAGQLVETREIAETHLATVMEQLRHTTPQELLAYQPPPIEERVTKGMVRVECFDSSGNPLSLPLDPGALSEPLPNPLEVRATVTCTAARNRHVSTSASMLFVR